MKTDIIKWLEYKYNVKFNWNERKLIEGLNLKVQDLANRHETNDLVIFENDTMEIVIFKRDGNSRLIVNQKVKNGYAYYDSLTNEITFFDDEAYENYLNANGIDSKDAYKYRILKGRPLRLNKHFYFVVGIIPDFKLYSKKNTWKYFDESGNSLKLNSTSFENLISEVISKGANLSQKYASKDSKTYGPKTL